MKTLIFTEASLIEALGNVKALHEMSVELIAECVFSNAQPAREAGGDEEAERRAALVRFAETFPMTSASAAGGNSYDLELRRYYLLGWDDRAVALKSAEHPFRIRLRENGQQIAAEVDRVMGQAPVARTYTTQTGESVAGIAFRQLGDESRWEEVRDLNARPFPDMGPHDYYPVGTVLAMPASDSGEG